jgi:hypothetical protein
MASTTTVKRGPTKSYAFDGYAGLVERRKTRRGVVVGLYAADQAGMEDDPELPWATVCEDHGSIVCHPTLQLARDWMAAPHGWCDDCREKNNDE